MSRQQQQPELDPRNWAPDWRSQWEVLADAQPMPAAWHRSGLCYLFEFEQIDEAGNWGWLVWDADISQSRLYELREELGEDAFQVFTLVIGRQAKVLWAELGHGDMLLRKWGSS